MPDKAMTLILIAMAMLRYSAASPGQEMAVGGGSRYGPVAPLNRWTFGGNVLAGDRADHWVVLFCVDWYEACEEAMISYEALAEEHSRRLNQGSIWRDAVRFASVDCAVDKVLCNEQLVDNYPTVAHYAGGKRVAAKAGSRGSLAKWLQKELPKEGLDGSSEAKPLLTDEERALALRVLACFAALIALFLWAVSQGADLWLYYTTMRVQQPKPWTTVKEECKAPCERVLAEQPSAARPIGGAVTRRLPQDWAQERGGLHL